MFKTVITMPINFVIGQSTYTYSISEKLNQALAAGFLSGDLNTSVGKDNNRILERQWTTQESAQDFADFMVSLLKEEYPTIQCQVIPV